MEDEKYFFEFCEREFTEVPKDFADSKAFTTELYMIFFQSFWNLLHLVMFGADAYQAFKQQQDYLMHKIIKPMESSVESVFRRIESFTDLFPFFPPPGSRGKMVTTE